MRRTQIYLETEQDRELTKRAMEAGTTKSTVIREAIDAYLASSIDDVARLAHFRAALDDVTKSPAALPDGLAYVEGMRAVDERRQLEIERRRE